MATDSPGEEFVTIVPVGETQLAAARDPAFVTVLTLGAAAGAAKVVVRRPRGARLGLGLKFEGGSAAAEKVRRLLVQSCAEDSPAANATTPWGKLIPGDEILAIDGVSVSDLTRIDCVRRLKDSDETLTLLVRHFETSEETVVKSIDSVDSAVSTKQKSDLTSVPNMLPPPVPPRKLGKKNSFKDKSLAMNGSSELKAGITDKDGNVIGPTNGVNNKLSRKSSFDSHIHRQNKETIASLKRGSPEEVRRLVRRLSDGKTMPPEAEVYIDLLSNEWERCLALADAESDDTGSSISTVVDRLSSMASSVENSIPSTPIMQPKTIDIQKVLNCIENIDSDILRDITTTRIIEKHTECKVETKLAEKIEAYHSILNESSFTPLLTDDILTNPKKMMNDKNNNSTIGNNTCDSDGKETDNSEMTAEKQVTNIPTEKPKPMPRNTKTDKNANDQTKKPLTLPERPPLVMTEPLLTPTKKNCIETWLQRSEAEMISKSADEEDTIPEVLPRLIDFVPKTQFKECETVPAPILRPTTAPPPPPVDQREDGSGASLDTIGELDETSDGSDIQKQSVAGNDVKERKSSFEASFWEDRVNKSDFEDKSLSNDETPPPTCPRQPPDGVETPSDVVEKTPPETTARLPPRLPTGWPTNRARFSYSRQQDARSEASVKDKIAMFSNDTSASTDRIDKCGTLPTKTMSASKKEYSRNYSDISSLDRRLTKSQDNLDDPPRTYKRHVDRPDVLGALENDVSETSVSKINHTVLTESKPLFYASTTTLPSLESSYSGYHTRSSSDDSTKSSHMSNLEFLIEQRKKSMSKLRGLVIPEGNGPVTDLPAIKVQDPLKNLFLNTCQNNKRANKVETKTPKQNISKPLDFNDTKWKASLMSNNLPKYSPAFKRKSLQVYSPTSISKESTPERKTPDIYSRNGSHLLSSTITRTSMDSKSTISKSLYSPSIYSFSNYAKIDNKDVLGSVKNFNNMEIKICTATEVVDSDNDSAMSSTQSSYRSSASSPLHNMDSIESDSSRISPKLSHFTPYSIIKTEIPTKSLIKEKSCEEYVKRNVSRSVSSDTTVSLSSSAGSAATSGSQASCSSLESSVPDLDKRKNGKTYCIDTINRRNILASAKCRSGRDNKLNSPVIETKFSHEPYERSPSPPKKTSDHLSTLTSSVSAIANKGENRRRSKIIADTDSDSDSEVNLRQRKSDFKNTRLKRSSSNKNKQTEATVEQSKLEDAPKAISERIIKEINKAGLDNFPPMKPTLTTKISKSTTASKLVEDIPKIQAVIKAKPNKLLEDSSPENSITTIDVKPVTGLRSISGVERIINPGPDSQSQTLRLRRGAAAGVGVILAGGSDCEAKDVTVHRVLTDSVADKAGLKRGAKVLSINGSSMNGLTHAQSVAILKEQRSEIVIELEYENKSSTQTDASKKPDKVEQQTPKPSCLGDVVTVVLDKAGGGAGLGFGLDGGRDSPLGDKPLTVKKLFTGGAAASSGNIIVGAELLSAGGQSMEGYTRTQAWAALKALPAGPVTLVLRNPKTT